MAYSDIYGNRPPEFASKSSHSYVIKDKDVNDYLKDCQLPKDGEDFQDDLASITFKLDNVIDSDNPIKYVLAVDCGYSKSIAKKSFPSSEVALFQFGALFLDLANLKELVDKAFVDPKEIAKLKRALTWNLVLPIAGIRYKQSASLSDSIRLTLNQFFLKRLNPDNQDTLLTALRWLIYQEYSSSPTTSIKLNACPQMDCHARDIDLPRNQDEYTCDQCGQALFLVDIFRLDELVDEEQGASGIMMQLSSVIEQLLVVYYLRFFVVNTSSYLGQILFLVDRPLAFFGQTALLHKYMRSLVRFLQEQHSLFLAGVEKSGSFVDHAIEIASRLSDKLPRGYFLLPNNDYIYKHITPRKSTNSTIYGSSSLYGVKLIFRAATDKVHVVSLPAANPKVIFNPQPSDFKNITFILNIIEKLRCDMYDNALLPVTLVNKSVSLAHRPSAVILEKFTRYRIQK